MRKFIDNLLKLDYSLSDWFSKTKQTIIPGTAFLFLNKLAFLFTAIYCIVLLMLPFQLTLKMSIVILCSLIALIMYGLQGRIQNMVRNLNYSKEYSKLSSTTKKVRRSFGLGIFIVCFILMFVIVVLSFEGYSR
jgi:hypothetical protein